MREVKNSISSLLATIIDYRVCLQKLMNDDQNMALMNLSILAAQPELYLTSRAHELLPGFYINIFLIQYLMKTNHLDEPSNKSVYFMYIYSN